MFGKRIFSHQFGNELVSRHEHDVCQKEVVEEHVGGRRVRSDDIFVASTQVSRVQPGFQQMFQHLLWHASHYSIPNE